MRFRKGTKRLGGEPPRRPGRWQRELQPEDTGKRSTLLLSLGIGLFVVGVVVGYAWGLDRQIRGGILRQRAEAAQRPDWVSLRALPEYVPQAFLAVVEPGRLEAGTLRPPEEQTTLARELVHQVHLLPPSVAGEAQELAMGPVLERHLQGPGLVELFLNRAHLGSNRGVRVYGIWHAAREYFGKDPRQLTLGETATLAGLLLPPRIQEPKSRIGAVGTRRNEVLQVMLVGGLITDEQFRQALQEPLGFQLGLEQMPMSRPSDWGQPTQPIRLPPSLRPVPRDSAQPAGSAG